MIIDVNKESLELLAMTGCLVDWRVDGPCMLDDNKAYSLIAHCTAIDFCRACWLKWLSKESENNHEE